MDRWSGGREGDLLLLPCCSADERLEESAHNILSASLVLITHREMGSVRGGGGFYWGWKLLDQTRARPARPRVQPVRYTSELGQFNSPHLDTRRAICCCVRLWNVDRRLDDVTERLSQFLFLINLLLTLGLGLVSVFNGTDKNKNNFIYATWGELHFTTVDKSQGLYEIGIIITQYIKSVKRGVQWCLTTNGNGCFTHRHTCSSFNK